MAKPAQEAEMANTVTFHTWLVCAHVNHFECCEEQDGERWCQQSDECMSPSPRALWSIAYAVSLDNSRKQALTRWRIQLRRYTHSIIWVFPQLLTSVWFYSSCDFILIISVPPAKPVAFVFSRVKDWETLRDGSLLRPSKRSPDLLALTLFQYLEG